VDQPLAPVLLELLAQITHIHLDHVAGAAAAPLVPDRGQDPLAAHHLAGVAQEQEQQLVFALGEGQGVVAAASQPPQGVEP
jgi:glyoxylase-like metal-dependent hydrolase (beta-lactamase superfamily II)